MRTLLFTQCLQRDFVAPLPPGEPLPNALHIGRSESRRLLGDPGGDWQHDGPLARFLRAWSEGATPEHAAVHIRDWHAPDDPETRGHLDHFGDHCLRGTPGATFVAPLDRLAERGGSHVVDSAVLSDFVGTRLGEVLGALAPEPRATRAGIIGVWTDFKVRYLAWDLMTRLGFAEVAVCSALTASRSRIRHRQALEHLEDSLGVCVVDSLPEFLGWLGIGWHAPPREAPRRGPRVEVASGEPLDDEEHALVTHLFRDCGEVSLTPLGGGFSGSRVFRSRSVDRDGRDEVPFVVKLDLHAKIAKERVAVESVENLLGAASPRMVDYVDLETRGALKYHFATMHGGDVRTLQSAVRAAAGPVEVRALFEGVIERVLRRLYQRPVSDARQLFHEYGYRPEYVEGTLARVASLGAERGDLLEIEGLGEPLPHPRRFYARLSEWLHEEPREVACCWIHGDLNLANVLLDATGNVWLIDYFWTRVGHALQDVAKLENDLKFILLPLADDAALRRAADWEGWLQDREAPLALPEDPPGPEDGEIAKVHAAVAVLRNAAARLVAEAGLDPAATGREYRIALLRYSAHTLSFDECDARQKRLALASTAWLADGLSRRA